MGDNSRCFLKSAPPETKGMSTVVSDYFLTVFVF